MQGLEGHDHSVVSVEANLTQLVEFLAQVQEDKVHGWTGVQGWQHLQKAGLPPNIVDVQQSVSQVADDFSI